MPKKAAASTESSVLIPELKTVTALITVYGTEPLIVHAFSQKARNQMLDKQMGVATQGRERKHPFRDFVESLYWLSEKPDFDYTKDSDALLAEFYRLYDNKKTAPRFGFKSIGFKASMVTAVTSIASMTKVAARQAFHIDGEFVEISGIPKMREDMVRVGMGTSDIRFRPEFDDWSVTLPITFNSAVITQAQVANILNTAGFAVGVGDYRPERDGNFGRFALQPAKTAKKAA